MDNIIGRLHEIEELRRLYASKRAEFVAVVGRRRVGKTYLIRQLFKDQFAFSHAGVAAADIKATNLLRSQLQNFGYSLRYYGLELDHELKDWFEAFHELKSLLEKQRNGQRQVVFIDEMPWLDTPRSGFVSALENFWNGWAAFQDDLMLIVCGSATAWMMDKLINNHGGLYGRITRSLHLKPFNLCECQEYYNAYGIEFSRYDQMQAYMMFGGIPFYLSALRRGLSLVQNVDVLFFDRDAPFANELERMFASLFVNHQDYLKVVSLLATRSIGFSRGEIGEKAGFESGSHLTDIIDTLKNSDFIAEYIPFGGNRSARKYKLTDCFSLFYLHFIKEFNAGNQHFWQDNFQSPAIRAWAGFAFENLCFCHLPQIKRALGISAVSCNAGPWLGKSKESKVQIDMLIVRNDRVINVCEMKFTQAPFEMTADDEADVRRRLTVLQSETKTDYALHPTLITTFPPAQNMHSGIIQSTITMDAFFSAD